MARVRLCYTAVGHVTPHWYSNRSNEHPKNNNAGWVAPHGQKSAKSGKSLGLKHEETPQTSENTYVECLKSILLKKHIKNVNQTSEATNPPYPPPTGTPFRFPGAQNRSSRRVARCESQPPRAERLGRSAASAAPPPRT